MRLRALVVASGLLWPASVFSQIGPSSFVTGNDLYDECTNSTESAKHIHCTGYVTGIADFLNMDGSVCLPANVTVRQIEDVIVNYLRQKPRYRQISASALAGTALRKAFPCK
jgi:Ssp1 endopeptidase immunity protein Rap1a